MPPEILLTIALVLGFIVAACAVMAVLAWVGVLVLRNLDRRSGRTEGREQSSVVAGGLFELGEVRGEDDVPPQP